MAKKLHRLSAKCFYVLLTCFLCVACGLSRAQLVRGDLVRDRDAFVEILTIN